MFRSERMFSLGLVRPTATAEVTEHLNFIENKMAVHTALSLANT